jgi:hypothetical protein
MKRKTNVLAVGILFASLSQAAFSENRTDYDIDNNGLIEINDLSDLNQIRYSLNGQSLYGSSAGCPASGCFGFEQTTDLDFDINQDGLVNSLDGMAGEGFVPIGSSGSEFSAIYDGGGHEIQNLTIDRTYEQFIGLFGAASYATIKNLGLTGPAMYVSGYNYVGAIAGSIDNSTLSAVYVTGKVGGRGNVGGLVGTANNSTINASFSTGSVKGVSYTGGLVGGSTGTSLSYSYAAGHVSANYYVGGMVGASHYTSSVINSYWAKDATTKSFSSGSNSSNGVTLSNLKCPVVANESSCSGIMLYENWDDIISDQGDPIWDFGTPDQLPSLN